MRATMRLRICLERMSLCERAHRCNIPFFFQHNLPSSIPMYYTPRRVSILFSCSALLCLFFM